MIDEGKEQAWADFRVSNPERTTPCIKQAQVRAADTNNDPTMGHPHLRDFQEKLHEFPATHVRRPDRWPDQDMLAGRAKRRRSTRSE